MEYNDARVRSQQAMETMENAGVRQMINKQLKEAAKDRKAHFERMAHEALTDAGFVEDAADKAVDAITRKADFVEAEEAAPVMQVRERPAPEGREVRVNAPVNEHIRTSPAKPKVEFDKPMPDGASFADLFGIPAEERNLNLGKHLRGVLSGNWSDADAEREHYEKRVMSGATAGAGADLLPVVYSSQIIDLARTQMRVMQAGARIVPMSARQIIMPQWTSDPTVAWRDENGSVGTSDATVDQLTFNARSLAGYTTLSREIVFDTDLSDLLATAYAKAVAKEFDRVALLGTGTPPQPLGLKNNTAITDKSAIVTNGASPTYDDLLNAVGSVRGRNEEPNAIIYHPRNELALAKLRDGTSGVYLSPPPYLDGVRRLDTGVLPVNEAEGTSGTVCNTMFVGDFSQLMLGVRANFSVNVYEQPSFATGQLVLVVHFRGDCQIGRASAFAVRTGLKA